MAAPVTAPPEISTRRIVRRHDPGRFPLICKIEEDTKKFVSIESRVTDDTLAKCHQQQQSAFFRLPPELRNEIYRHAAQPNKGYGSDVMRADTKPDTRFLLTCRRIWLEANSYPLKQYTPTFWTARGPVWDEFMDNLTPVNVESLREVHVTVEVNPVHERDGIAVLESLPFQAWPPKLILSFMSKPISVEDNTDLGACIARMLKHPKIATIRELEIRVEEVKSKAGYLPEMLAQLANAENQLYELGITELRPYIDTKPVRSWHREATNMLPYDTYKLVYRRKAGTGKRIPEVWTGDRRNSWHLIPWREMYYSMRTMARMNFEAANALAAEYQKGWSGQSSLLKFAD